jgi:hypothetical protein
MTTIRAQRPAVSHQPNMVKKGHSGRVSIFCVSNRGGQKITKHRHSFGCAAPEKTSNQDVKGGVTGWNS